MRTVIFVYFEGSRAHASQVKLFYKCTSKPEKNLCTMYSVQLMNLIISHFKILSVCTTV